MLEDFMRQKSESQEVRFVDEEIEQYLDGVQAYLIERNVCFVILARTKEGSLQWGRASQAVKEGFLKHMQQEVARFESEKD